MKCGHCSEEIGECDECGNEFEIGDSIFCIGSRETMHLDEMCFEAQMTKAIE